MQLTKIMTENEKLFSLHRYYMSANLMRTHFDQIITSEDISTKKGIIESMHYMSYWYGGLYVVVEGWKELHLHDIAIDALLGSPNVDLLRRFRNGVFHFKKKYNDKRFMEFMTEGKNVIVWVRELNKNFGRYFLDELNKLKAIS